jgi:hypothetical protein
MMRILVTSKHHQRIKRCGDDDDDDERQRSPSLSLSLVLSPSPNANGAARLVLLSGSKA